MMSYKQCALGCHISFINLFYFIYYYHFDYKRNIKYTDDSNYRNSISMAVLIDSTQATAMSIFAGTTFTCGLMQQWYYNEASVNQSNFIYKALFTQKVQEKCFILEILKTHTHTHTILPIFY